jgi:hypothetical protein
MTREEFRLKAIIELAAAMTSQSGAWKAKLDMAIEMAEYLTTQVYGQQEPDINVD